VTSHKQLIFRVVQKKFIQPPKNNGYNPLHAFLKPLFSTVPLVAEVNTFTSPPLFPYFGTLLLYVNNKGIRVWREVLIFIIHALGILKNFI
jgi:hypothetical protein